MLLLGQMKCGRLIEQQFHCKPTFLSCHYHSCAKRSNMHAKDLDQRSCDPVQILLSTVNNHIVFFTVYHVSLALLMVVDGDVTLCASVEDYGKVIVINVLSGSGEAAAPGRVKGQSQLFFENKDQRAISLNRQLAVNLSSFMKKRTQINVFSLFLNRTKRWLSCGKMSSWCRFSLEFVVLQVRAAFKQAN